MALVLAGHGGRHSIQRAYSRLFHPGAPVIIIGGGRVGRAAARGLEERGLDYRVIELQAERNRNPEKYVIGNAAELDVLKRRASWKRLRSSSPRTTTTPTST
jgi:2-polyprenyl-6-methoxyphenol hydroxylase-like FAD-dependent oxidoreductase